MVGVFGKPGLSRRDQTGALAWAKGEGSFRERRPRLDLNKGEQALAFGDQVNLSRFSAHPLAKDKPTLGSQRGGGEGFRILTGGIGAPAARQAMGGWGLAGHGVTQGLRTGPPAYPIRMF